MVPLQGPLAHSPDWFSFRAFDPKRPVVVRFGASEASAVCGVSGYKSPYQIYLEKRGEIDVDREETDAQWLGNRVEDTILDYAQRKYGYTLLRRMPALIHPEFQWLIATCDSMIVEPENTATWISPMEAKHLGWQRMRYEDFGAEDTDEIAVDWIYQANQQMLVTDTDNCVFAVMTDKRLRRYLVPRNGDIVEHIVESSRELYAAIRDGVPPEPDFELEADQKLVRSMSAKVEFKGKKISLDTDVAALYTRRSELRDQRLSIEDQVGKIKFEEKALTAQIVHALEDASYGELPSGTIIQRSIRKNKGYTVKPFEYVLISEVKPKEE